MQGFNFGLRKSTAADGMDDIESRYVSGSIYSGNPNESRAPSAAAQFTTTALQGFLHENQPRYNPVSIATVLEAMVLTLAAESRAPPKFGPTQYSRPGRNALAHGNSHK